MFGASYLPVLVLNVVYPLVPEEPVELRGKSAVLVVEEGYPDYIEQAVNVELRRADINARARQRAVAECRRIRLRCAARRIAASAGNKAERHRCRHDGEDCARPDRSQAGRRAALGALPSPARLLHRLSERPVFSAIKLMQRELGPTHIDADIGCHSFATFAPFSLGNSILGYGISPQDRVDVTNMEGADRDHGHASGITA